ncbi:MAG: hypothetical protein MUC43_04855 [Pirellula sp.]|nr:hypothetical protein [Pirellula sp.]
MVDRNEPSESLSTPQPIPPPRDTSSSPPVARPFQSNDLDRKTTRIVILAMLFFVTGFLGLPVLWLSKSFSLTEKLVWSIVNTVYTCALIAGTVAICIWALRPFFTAIF